jgi:hypothetical protein
MPRSLQRHHFQAYSTVLFLLVVGATISAIGYLGWQGDNSRRYISQMNDRGSGGALILALVALSALIAGGVAATYGRYFAASLRVVIALLILVIGMTEQNAANHGAAYLGVVALYGMMTIGTLAALLWSSLTGLALSLPLGCFGMFLIAGNLGAGPSGQKIAVMSFLVVECVTLCVWYPRRFS